MKKYLIFFILVTGCYSDIPDNLISEKKMESIIFDIMILNASSGYDLKIDNNLLSDELIFKKYDIDSLQFYESELCLLYTSPSPRDATLSRMPSSA